jgi:hypothetical protein
MKQFVSQFIFFDTKYINSRIIFCQLGLSHFLADLYGHDFNLFAWKRWFSSFAESRIAKQRKYTFELRSFTVVQHCSMKRCQIC